MKRLLPFLASIAAPVVLVFGISSAAATPSQNPPPKSSQMATRFLCDHSPTYFFVDPGLYNLGGPPGETQLGFCASGAATAKVDLFAPAGVAINLAAKPGTVIGRLSEKSDRVGKKVGIDFPLRNGSIVAADPKLYAHSYCTPGVHDAVWLLRTRTVDGRFVIALPLFVDEVRPGAGNGYSIYLMRMCFSSPNGRIRVSGWPARTVFRKMNLYFYPTVVSEQPTVPAAYVWRGVFTPFLADGHANVAGRFEAQATQLLPVVWTLSGQYDPAQQAAHVSGSITEGGQPVQPIQSNPYGFAGGIVRGTALGGTFPGILNATWDPLTVDANGHFSETVPIAQTTYFRASGGDVLHHLRPLTGCKGPTIAPKGCVSATQSGFAMPSPIITVTVP